MSAINAVIAPIALLVCAAVGTPVAAAAPAPTSDITVKVRNSSGLSLKGTHGLASNVTEMTTSLDGSGIGTVTGNGDAFDFRYSHDGNPIAHGVNFAVRNYFGVTTPVCHVDVGSSLDCGYASGRSDDGKPSIIFFIGTRSD